MYSCEMFATNLAFQEGDFIVVICFHCEVLTKRPLFKSSYTYRFTFFFFVLEAISKVDSKSFNVEMAAVKHALATTTAQCSLGTIQDGGLEKINNVSVS